MAGSVRERNNGGGGPPRPRILRFPENPDKFSMAFCAAALKLKMT